MGVIQGRIIQDSAEEIIYGLDVTNVSSSDGTVSGPTMIVYEINENSYTETDVSSTVTSGSMSVSGQVITLEKILSLTKGKLYRAEIIFTKDGQVLTEDIFIKCPLEKLR